MNLKDENGPIEASSKEAKEQAEELQRLRDIVRKYHLQQRDYQIPIRTPENTMRFGVIGDTHFGSLFERTDALATFYELLASEGVQHVLHAGDVIEGHKMYKGQEYEMYVRGLKELLDIFEEKAPRIPGITTHFITGNHDLSFNKSCGCDVGDHMATRRDDWKHVGDLFGTVNFMCKAGHRLKAHMVHPSGGTPYALSYRTQKIIEAMSGGTKPDLLLVGHLHKSEHLPCYRNVDGILTGTFQSQTPFMAAKPTPAHVGGWIIEVVLGERSKLVSRVKGEFISFYEPEDSNE